VQALKVAGQVAQRQGAGGRQTQQVHDLVAQLAAGEALLGAGRRVLARIL